MLGGFQTGSLIWNRAQFAWKTGNVKAVTAGKHTKVPNPRLPVVSVPVVWVRFHWNCPAIPENVNATSTRSSLVQEVK